MTLSWGMTFHLNDEKAHVIHARKAHTDGDLFIRFEKANVIHTGDIMFNGLFPYIDMKNGGSIEGYITAQKRILKLRDKETKIIPGHGPIASIDMLNDTKSIINDLIKNGKTEDEIAS